MITTKEQERKALEQIRKIVDGLGEDSYIGTAFEGCFEIAEENIENDFACSMKQRVEATVVENARLKEKIKSMELDNRDLRLAIKKVKEESSARETALQAMAISPDDMADVRQLLKDRMAEDEQMASKAAAEIVEHADNTASNEFQNAVRMHRAYIASADYIKSLMDRLQKASAN